MKRKKMIKKKRQLLDRRREGGKDGELGIGYLKSFCFQNILLYCYGYFCVFNDKIGIFWENTH